MLPNATALAAIKAKLAGDQRYAGLSPADAAKLLNTMVSQNPKVFAAAPLTKGQLMAAIAPAILAVGSAPANVQAKWQPMLNFVLGIPDGAAVDPSVVAGLVEASVADNLLTQDQVNAVVAAGQVEVLTSDSLALGFSYLSADDVTAALAS